MLNFVLPNDTHRADVLSFYQEFARNGESCIGFGNCDNYDLWLAGMKNRHLGKNLPEGWVRENFYLCYDGAEPVGVFSLKFELTDFLLHYGGHIGYAVRPSRRNHGAATQILEQGLKIAEGFGFSRILCVCDVENVASEKVILRNGGVLENILFDPEEQVSVKRYWIELPAP